MRIAFTVRFRTFDIGTPIEQLKRAQLHVSWASKKVSTAKWDKTTKKLIEPFAFKSITILTGSPEWEKISKTKSIKGILIEGIIGENSPNTPGAYYIELSEDLNYYEFFKV